MILKTSESWCWLVRGHGLATADGEWASEFSKELRVPTLALFLWDGEASLLARRFESGDEVERLELPKQAKRRKDGRAIAAAGVLSPWARTRGKTLLLDDGPSDVEDEDDAHPFVPLEASSAAVAKALRLPADWLRAEGVEVEEGDMIVAFRAKGEAKSLPLLPPVPPRVEATAPTSVVAKNLAAYRGRSHAVGWFAFDEQADLEAFLLAYSSFVRRFTPAFGLDACVSRGQSSRVFPGASPRAPS